MKGFGTFLMSTMSGISKHWARTVGVVVKKILEPCTLYPIRDRVRVRVRISTGTSRHSYSFAARHVPHNNITAPTYSAHQHLRSLRCVGNT